MHNYPIIVEAILICTNPEMETNSVFTIEIQV